MNAIVVQGGPKPNFDFLHSFIKAGQKRKFGRWTSRWI
jgi:hypothetical protein